jgi:putative transposase
VKYQFIATHPEYPDKKWAAMLEVSRSGFYEWRKTRNEREAREESYDALVRKIFEENNSNYGAGRICGEMRKRGSTASFDKVSRSMKKQGLKCVHMRRRQRSLTDSSKACGDGYPNLTRDLEIKEPFQVLSSDITYIRTQEGFEYLCQVKDVVSGVILAQSMSNRMKADLVTYTVHKVLQGWNLPADCIFHSDRGSQYTASSTQELLKTHGISQSFSRVGKPGDNAWSESFFANLKKEAVHWVHFRTREEARNAMFAYIEGYYNTRRIQRRLGYRSPIEWLEVWDRNDLEVVA